MKIASPELERSLARDWGIVAGMDEVGRGSLAGPVAVGVALTSLDAPPPPQGLTDSKALTARRREALVPEVRAWVIDSAVGYASSQEIDQWGIVAALRLAGRRALADVMGRGHTPGGVLLDGVHDWLSLPTDLFSALEGPTYAVTEDFPVRTQAKADASCSVVAAASVLAKVDRDRFMSRLEDPGYGWASNKGYSSSTHIEALGRLGVSDQHRTSWKLPSVSEK